MTHVPVVAGKCPACGTQFLSLLKGKLWCCYRSCPRPNAAHEVLADAGTWHVVRVGETSWNARHPLIERLDDELLSCGIGDFLEQERPEPGTYVVEKVSGQWTLTKV